MWALHTATHGSSVGRFREAADDRRCEASQQVKGDHVAAPSHLFGFCSSECPDTPYAECVENALPVFGWARCLLNSHRRITDENIQRGNAKRCVERSDTT
jgi:hypothetical protein